MHSVYQREDSVSATLKDFAMARTGIAALQRYFRTKRNRLLVELIERASTRLCRPVRILDVGGRAVFWDTIDSDKIESIAIGNIEEADIRATSKRYAVRGIYANALDLSGFTGGEFDMVVSNSVIEHLETWRNIKLCAAQLRAVAPCGYVQTPAFWFPVEQHFMIPFFHWLPPQVRAALLPHLPRVGYENVGTVDVRRQSIEEINLLTGEEMQFLFPDAQLHKEKLLFLTKSYTAIWDHA